MVDLGGKFSFLCGMNVRIDIRIDISISIRPMTTKFNNQVQLETLTQVRLMKQVLKTS